MRKRSALLLAALVFILASCKTTSPAVEEQVNVLALLEQDSSIYVRIPVSSHVDLTSAVLSSAFDGVSKKEARSFAQRVSELYAGIGTVEDRSRIQVASSASIPQVAVGTVFSKKNGWSKRTYNAKTTDAVEKNCSFTVYDPSAGELSVSFPSPSVFVSAAKVEPLLNRYAEYSDYADLSATSYSSWVSQQSSDILFYITRPGQYLRNLIGQSVSIGTDAIYGSLSYIPSKKNPDSYSGLYSMMFRIHLLDKRAASAFRSVLSLSFGMMGAKITQIDDFTIEISDVEITQKQIEDLFMRDPVTGKHFKVVGDKIIKE